MEAPQRAELGLELGLTRGFLLHHASSPMSGPGYASNRGHSCTGLGGGQLAMVTPTWIRSSAPRLPRLRPQLSSLPLCQMLLCPLSCSVCPWGSSPQALELPRGILTTQTVGSCKRAFPRAPQGCWCCWSGNQTLTLSAPTDPVGGFTGLD